MKKSILIASGILLATASPAFAQNASLNSHPITEVTNTFTGVEVVAAAAKQAAKIINPYNNPIEFPNQSQRDLINGLYIANISTNVIATGLSVDKLTKKVFNSRCNGLNPSVAGQPALKDSVATSTKINQNLELQNINISSPYLINFNKVLGP